MAVKHVCAIRIRNLVNHTGAYHLYFPYLKMPLQSMRGKKTCQKLQLIGKGSSSTLPTKLQAVKHSACGVIGSVLLVVLALR